MGFGVCRRDGYNCDDNFLNNGYGSNWLIILIIIILIILLLCNYN